MTLPKLSFGLGFGILMMVAIALTFALSPTSASAAHPDPVAIDVDGRAQDPVTGVVEAPYVLSGITYTQDQATGEFAGLLYTAHDDDNLYSVAPLMAAATASLLMPPAP